MVIRAFSPDDIPAMMGIWNSVVEEGIAFPQTEILDLEAAVSFFSSQSRAAVADADGEIVGLYILHPNNVGRCAHICNCSYAVKSDKRGLHIGESLVLDSMEAGRRLGFRIMQFNAVVRTNIHARHLYERLGFTPLGTIPGGFCMKDGRYEDIVPYFREL